MGDLLGPIKPYITLGTQLCSVFFVVFTIALAFWMYRDATRRGAMGWFWAVATLFFNVAAWAIYMMVRPPETLDDAHERELEIMSKESEVARGGGACPNCFKPIEPDFLICPSCMKRLKKACTSCGRPLKTAWSVCPYCRSKQVPADNGDFNGDDRPRSNRAADTDNA